MCGRFGVEEQYIQLALRYQATISAIDPGPRYNVAPTQPVPVVVERKGTRLLDEFRWGLIPRWAKDMKIGNRLINARAETIASTPAFRDAFKWRRCVIPATRYYEWQRVGAAKIPQSIALAEGVPMSFAGLWDSWVDPLTGEAIYSCSIVTTAASSELAAIHDRMPVVLPEDAIAIWLDRSDVEPAALGRLLLPSRQLFVTTPVSRLVNDPKNDGPELLDPDRDGVSAPTQLPFL
jgi:putative SOS response-associated peptidase YedK